MADQRPWAEDEKAKAIALRREGKGATYIAAALGRSRLSVVGFLWRQGEPGLLKNRHSVAPSRAAAPRSMSWEHEA